VDEREQRMAQNEALFREVNERVDELADEQRDHDAELSDYLCECANADCTFRVPLSGVEYEAIRSEPTQFAVLPGHFTPEVEVLVSRRERYWIVKKLGEAGAYVEALDPRSR